MIRILAIGIQMKFSHDFERRPRRKEYHVITANTGHEAITLLQKEEIDVAILDATFSHGGGIDLVGQMKRVRPSTEIIVLIGWASVETAVKAMKLGAFDCLSKPVKISDVSEIVARAVEKTKRLREKNTKESGKEVGDYLQELIGETRQMKRVKKLISLLGTSDGPVLILGETGTGKELAARAVHMASNRSDSPFVAVNMSALPENILESELFGYRKGAFTGAASDKTGLLEIANGGTFFADEIGDMGLAIQAKLLRVIETGTFRKLGDTRETKVNVRLVSATNKDLEEECKTKAFRSDLFYRLSTFIVELPPLRERREDIPLLSDHFLSRYSTEGVKKRISPQGFRALYNHQWPGNVRELMNVLERAVLLSSGQEEIDADMLCLKAGESFNNVREIGVTSYLLQDMGKQHIQQVLEAANGNKTVAARLLGISRATLYRKLSPACHASQPVYLKRLIG